MPECPGNQRATDQREHRPLRPSGGYRKRRSYDACTVVDDATVFWGWSSYPDCKGRRPLEGTDRSRP